MSKKAIIIGAGPAGLTAAYELLKRTDIAPIILEKSDYIGGISRTINYKGNRMDMGPHRFFSKADRVMDWWLKMMPLETAEKDVKISYQNKSREVKREDVADNTTHSTKGKDPDKVMLVIQRLTRIYFLRKFFAYPIQLSIATLRTLGLIRTIKIMFSFLWIRLFPHKPEKSLEDFIINKFGKQLYLLFFKDYTEKVWGVPCHEISAEWGAQRIKGVSLSKAVLEALKTMRNKKKGNANLGQKGTETSLIEQFLYPKYGPGSLWEEVARQVQEMGGKIFLNQDVVSIRYEDNSINLVHTINSQTGQTGAWEGDYYFSTMPVQELIGGMEGPVPVPAEVREVAAGLQYRDFINVGILLRQFSAPRKNGDFEKLELKDNWIYIQERDVKVGRLMIYNNWGGGMVQDPNTTWIGMEYFCNKTDGFWAQDDETIQGKAIMELEKMGLARIEDVLDITVRRMEKTYPAYFGTYDQFDKIRAYTDQFVNLFLVGRNGMHKYNNADHSMLTALVAVDNIIVGETSKANIWSINTEQEYHEEKKAETQEQTAKRPTAAFPYAMQPSFLDYTWRNKRNRAYLLFALVAFLVQFILFKVKYPFANFMPDSYSYLEAAYTNADVNMWPVAYSKFLRLISVFTHEDKLVVAIQYFFLQCSSLLFLSTLFYFIKPGRISKGILCIFFVFNLLPLYLANYISADALFIGFSLLWITSLLWIIYRPERWQIPVQALLLLVCFTLRYNALYYPIIGALAFLLSRQSWKPKAGGIVLSCSLVAISIIYTSAKMEKVTGQKQFSAFGGWQLANNALYMYQDIPAKERGSIPAKFAKLEAMVREHMDTLKRVKLTAEDSSSIFFYLWSPKGPLIQYLQRTWKNDTTTGYFKKWSSEGPLYASYGIYLIQKYPAQFMKSFLIPNALKFAVPPTEFLGTYNMGSDSVGKLVKEWFNYKSQKIKDHNKKENRIWMISWYPPALAVSNALLIISLLGLLLFNTILFNNGNLGRLALMFTTLWMLNMLFSISASPIVLRYQYLFIFLSLTLALFILEHIIQEDNLNLIPKEK